MFVSCGCCVLSGRGLCVGLITRPEETYMEEWMFVSCGCCVLSGRGLCVGLITRPEETYRVWRV